MHIPFCEKRCGYCAFNTSAGKDKLIGAYVDALLLGLSQSLQNRDKKFRSIYFGGGTPSLLNVAEFEKIFEAIGSFLGDECEITIEANPSSWNKQKALALKQMGANRISLGIQSLNDNKLRFLSRAHDAKRAYEAFDEAVKAGFENISVDLMYDTVEDNVGFLKKELSDFLSLEPTHISAYSLTIEEKTPFERAGIKSKNSPKNARYISDVLQKNGYEQYEVSSFGKKRSRHNVGYWEYRPYIGVGAGAVGFDGNAREYPLAEVEKYIKDPYHKRVEELTRSEKRTEKIFLGLRSCVGVEGRLLEQKESQIEEMIALGLLKRGGDSFFCTDYFLADELALKLI